MDKMPPRLVPRQKVRRVFDRITCIGDRLINLPNITRRFDEADLTSEWKKNANWQVIFKIRNEDGVIRDYCRETRWRSNYDIEDVERWAMEQCLLHKLHGAEIQLF
ncbi:Uncharacterised protein [Burkholderia pseudomallei]|nr:Uncharacterised protein [Burkholderia pseudomallei]